MTNRAALVTLAMTLVFLVLLGLLHVLEPEFAPSWRMISEYELGGYGWMMRLAFFSLALATIALWLAVRPHVQTLGGKLGLGLLVVSAMGIVLGGSFLTDPITTAPSSWTTSGTLHTVGGALMILLSPLATTLVSWSLARHNPAWRHAVPWLFWPALLIWLTTFAFFGVVSVKSGGGRAGPDVPMGWPNRAVIASYCGWLMAVARCCHAMTIRRRDVAGTPNLTER